MRKNAPFLFDGVDVVELGGASSRFVVDLAKHANARCTIIDNSDVGIEMSEEMFRIAGVSVEMINADIFALDGLDESFDVVTHWGLMEHFDDPSVIFRLSASLLRPGGHLVYSMPNMAAWGAALWRRHAPDNYAAHVFHPDTILQASADAAGLETLRTFHFGVPLLRMAPAEQHLVTAKLADVAHAGLVALGALAPRLYSSSNRHLASGRGFVLRKR